LSRALKNTFGVEQVRVLLEGHGREEYLEQTDISRTVGWFTSMYPFVLDGKQENIESVLLLQDSLSQVPDKGVGYGLLRYLSNEPLPQMEDAQVTFNYLGDFTREERDITDTANTQTKQATTTNTTNNTFSYSEYGHGLDVHPNLSRESELEVSGQSENGCLQMSIQFSAARMDESKMEQLAARYKAQLLTISQELSRYDKTLQLPGSFTYKGLTLEQIEELTKEYGAIEDVYRLSPMQQGLYYHAMSEPKSHAYFEQFGYGLKGDLDIAKLEQAYRTLIARHGVLRTVFRNDLTDEPLQVVLKEGIIDFRYEDIRDKDYSQQDQYIKQLRESDKDESFDLSAGPLVRLIIVQQSESSFYQIWSNHHLNLDGWSTNAVLYEFDILYKALVANKKAELEKLESYSRYIAWLDGIDHKKSRTYWNDYLSDYDSKATLPFDREDVTRSANYIPKDYEFWLSKELSDQISSIASAEKTTLNTIIQSAWGILLSRYNNTQDVVFGSVVSGRPSELKGIQEMIGIFINTVPQRIKYTEQTTFKELLKSTQQSFIEGEPHHHLNLAEIQHESDLGTNLLDHLVVFENYPISGQSEDTLIANKIQVQQGEVEIVGDTVEVFEQMNYDFTLIAAPEDRLFFRMKYNAAKYSDGFIKRLEGQWNQLLGEITKDASLPIINYDIITQEEKIYLLETLNETEADYPKDKTIVDLFEEQVNKTPNAIAIKFNDTVLTYSKLNEKSNQLANYLITNYDIQPADLVGIELERSEWMVIGILAIIKSGGAYVPIDPDYPEQRKEYLIKDSNCRLVVNNDFLSEFLKIENLISNSSIKCKNSTVLCCIYTSGSTGLPKGVQISHSNLLNRIYWMWGNYPFQNGEVTAIKTTIGFVDHLWEIFGALLHGVKSVVIPQEAIKEIGCFAEIINKENISRLVLVPSLLKFILTEGDLKNQFTSVKIWTASGEVLPVELVDQFYRTFGTATLLNIYGSTEITADVTCFNTSTMIVDEKNNVPKLFNPISDKDEYAEELFRDIHFNPVHHGNFMVDEILKEDETLLDNLQAYITELDTVVKKNVINVNSRYFIGHMTGPIPPFLYYVNKKMVQMNQNQVKLETSGIGTSIEQKVVGFFHREIYGNESSFYDRYDFNKETSLGLLTSGGTLSNITALQLSLSKSLNELLEKQGTTLQEIGLANALNTTELKGAVILASNLHHYSIQKAAKLMGLGTNSVIAFSSKNKEELNKLILQLKNEKKLIIALIGIAGTTESGEVDDLSELYKIAVEHKIHFHVDAAFGGAFILSSYKNKLKGIEYADSVTICGHKQLYTPIGCSLVLFKSPYLVKFSEHNARYQARKGSSDLGKFTNEGTRPFTALTLDAVRKLHTDGGYKEVLDSLVDKTNWMYRFLKQYDFIEVYAPPTLNILLYRYIPENLLIKHKSNLLTEEEHQLINRVNEELQQLQFQEGKFFVSQTRVKIESGVEKVWLRVVLMNPFTSKKDIQAVVLNQFQKLSISAQTETCIYSLSVPIGKSISNTKVLILDDKKKIQPLGALGEICIIGDAVANYLNENNGSLGYIKNPFDESKIMYCTGDFGRYLQDGNLLYEGRRDQQVKIAGNRVNVSEIRKVTLEVKDIRDAFISIHQNQIVLFVEGDEIFKNEIQLKLQTNLPRFMQPSRIKFVNQFILNANGKLDKKKMLELLEKEDLSENQLFEGTWLDGKIQKIWSRVLQKQEKEIPFNKDFFELGGDSLKLMSLTAAINKTFEKQFRFRDLLDVSTIIQTRDLINISNNQSEKTFYRLNSPIENTSPLLLLPPSNGEGLVYKNLAKILDQKIEIWTVDYNKGDDANLIDIQNYAQELAALWKREIGNKKLTIGGYSLGFRVAYHMALVFENRVEKLINIDGMLYKSQQEEEAINKIIIEEEKMISSSDNELVHVNNIQENIDLNLQKWFKNDYFLSKLNVQVHHFIGEDSPVKNYIPDYVSTTNEITVIKGNHENVIEKEENLLLISKFIESKKNN
jgi:fengycin family lipopeptide synthetase D